MRKKSLSLLHLLSLARCVTQRDKLKVPLLENCSIASLQKSMKTPSLSLSLIEEKRFTHPCSPVIHPRYPMNK